MLMGILMAGMLTAQEPVIKFDKTTHDFGKINEADGRVTTVFTFRNEGMSPLVLNNVRASCGCTTPKWTKEPVEPGQEGQITVTYNPNGRPGHFQKTITVTSNAKETTAKLFIKGEVIPKTVKPVDKFPVKMGDLSLAEGSVDFGDVTKGGQVSRTLTYTNEKVDSFLLSFTSDNYVVAYPSFDRPELMVQKGQKGEMKILFEAIACNQYGPVETAVYPVINGKKGAEPIVIRANVVEDFSKLSEADKMNAPILVINDAIDLGTFRLNAKKGNTKTTIQLANAGQNPLMVRRVVTTSEKIHVIPPKSIRSGKKGNAQVIIRTADAGTFELPVTFITNDPKQPVKKVTLRWTVQ